MKKQEFIDSIKDILELEDDAIMDEDSSLKDVLNSLGVLSIIALCDESFSKELTAEQIRSITTVKSLMEIIGLEHFED